MIPEILAAVAVGFASALLPAINAEAFQAGSSLVQSPAVVRACVVALAVGQTGGKVVIFTASRRGARRWRSTRDETSSRARRSRPGRRGHPSRMRVWFSRTNAAVLRSLSRPVAGPVTVAVSAAVGLPPLALVSAAAGVSTMRGARFTAACLSGRLTRFAVVAGLVALITTRIA